MWVLWVVGYGEDPVGVAVHFVGAETFLEKRRHLEGFLIIKFQMSVVQTNCYHISEGVVAQTQVLGLFILVINLTPGKSLEFSFILNYTYYSTF